MSFFSLFTATIQDVFPCPSEGFYPHPRICSKFYRCVNQDGPLTVFHFDCGPGTVFDTRHNICNYRYAIPPRPGCYGILDEDGRDNHFPEEELPSDVQPDHWPPPFPQTPPKFPPDTPVVPHLPEQPHLPNHPDDTEVEEPIEPPEIPDYTPKLPELPPPPPPPERPQVFPTRRPVIPVGQQPQFPNQPNIPDGREPIEPPELPNYGPGEIPVLPSTSDRRPQVFPTRRPQIFPTRRPPLSFPQVPLTPGGVKGPRKLGAEPSVDESTYDGLPDNDNLSQQKGFNNETNQQQQGINLGQSPSRPQVHVPYDWSPGSENIQTDSKDSLNQPLNLDFDIDPRTNEQTQGLGSTEGLAQHEYVDVRVIPDD